ncbi:hypothetical protein [Paenibacillus sp. MMO-177]|uniref:hypothetical protein n=1 Tax=Paenibacillus sp. MMO-177 TaxID=3081289 RepID=UPI003015F683
MGQQLHFYYYRIVNDILEIKAFECQYEAQRFEELESTIEEGWTQVNNATVEFINKEKAVSISQCFR